MSIAGHVSRAMLSRYSHARGWKRNGAHLARWFPSIAIPVTTRHPGIQSNLALLCGLPPRPRLATAYEIATKKDSPRHCAGLLGLWAVVNWCCTYTRNNQKASCNLRQIS